MAIDVEAVIEETIERNKELAEAAIRAQSAAMTAAAGRIFAPPGFVATAPALRTEPPVFTPNTDLSAEFTRAYQEAFADFNPIILQATTDFLARYFPGAVAATVDDWIQRAIISGGTGIPAAIETAIWDRARGREATEARRLEQTVASQFAARGFLMPPGAMAAQMAEIQQATTNRSVTLNRDRAIKSAELEIENIRFAIENGLKARVAVIQSVSEYVRAWMKPAEEAVEYAKGLVAAKERLWASAADYFSGLGGRSRDEAPRYGHHGPFARHDGISGRAVL